MKQKRFVSGPFYWRWHLSDFMDSFRVEWATHSFIELSDQRTVIKSTGRFLAHNIKLCVIWKWESRDEITNMLETGSKRLLKSFNHYRIHVRNIERSTVGGADCYRPVKNGISRLTETVQSWKTFGGCVRLLAKMIISGNWQKICYKFRTAK